MADLSAKYWNAMVERVTERIVATIDQLVDALEASGYPPFTKPPEAEVRWLIYNMRPIEEWRFRAKTEPQETLEDIRDWANMARRRNQPEVAEVAARTVLTELAVQEMIPGGTIGETA